jgi:hypothetical protein
MNIPIDSSEQTGRASQFEDLPEPSQGQVQHAQAQAASKHSQGAPRLLEPNRAQVELRASDLESLLATKGGPPALPALPGRQ